MKNLEQLRDELVEKILGYHGCFTGDCPHGLQRECDRAVLHEMFDAALAELSKLAGEFDEKAVEEYSLSNIHPSNSTLLKANELFAVTRHAIEVSRWQFEQDRARIGLYQTMALGCSEREKECHDTIAKLTARAEKAERERDDYKKPVYEYVQATGNTSPKTLGYHVAEALVMDHKDLKAKLAAAERAIEDHKFEANTHRLECDKLEARVRELEGEDPTLYCTHCGAKTHHKCKCGPIPKND